MATGTTLPCIEENADLNLDTLCDLLDGDDDDKTMQLGPILPPAANEKTIDTSLTSNKPAAVETIESSSNLRYFTVQSYA